LIRSKTVLTCKLWLRKNQDTQELIN